MSLTWGASEHELIMLQQWLEQLPAEVVHSRPRLCLACAQTLVASCSTAHVGSLAQMQPKQR